MRPVSTFDAQAYTGLWYEVARFPVPFQDGCTETTATYEIVAEDELSVYNTCTRGGDIDDITGKAELIAPGQLKVSFASVPFVRSDYWVLWVNDDYTSAVVGTPSGRAGWVLNRTPDVSDETREMALSVLSANGYDTSRLLFAAAPE